MLSEKCIINLSNRKQYKIENTKYQKWINDLLIKYNLREKMELKETGVNNDSLLLKYCGDMCLNVTFENSLNSFDLQRKKIGFYQK